MTKPHPTYRLGPWQIDPRELTLRRGRQRNNLQARSMALLVELYRHLGSVVSKDDLAAAVWGSQGASDELIARHVSMIRQALGDNPRNAQFLETVPRRGYRLVQPLPPLRTPKRLFVAAAAVISGALIWWLWQPGRPGENVDSVASPSPKIRVLAGAEPVLPPGPFRADIANSPTTADMAFIEGGKIDLAGDLVLHNPQSGETTRLAGGLNRFPKFSPDGRFVAVFRHENTCQLLVIDTQTAGVTHRTACTGQVSSPVAWVSANELWYSVDRGPESLLMQWPLSQPAANDLWTAPAEQQIRFPVSAGQRRFALIRSRGADQLIELDHDGTPSQDLYGDPQTLVRWLSAAPDAKGLLMVKFDGIDRFGLFDVDLSSGMVRLISNRHTTQSAAYRADGAGVVHTVANYRSQHLVYPWAETETETRADPITVPILEDTSVTQAVVAPAGDQLVFLKNVGSGVALYHLDLRQGHSTLLRPAVSGQRLMFPRWSADGSRVLVATTQPFAVELMDARSGGNFKTYDLPLTPGPMTLANDGDTLFVVSPSVGQLRVYQMDLDSGHITQIRDVDGAWGQVSEDGQTLYLVDQQFRFGQTSLDERSDTTFRVNVGSLTGWQVVDQTLLAACPGVPTQSATLCEMNLLNGHTTTHPTLKFYPSHLSFSADRQWLVLPQLADLQMDLMSSLWAEADRMTLQ